MEKNSEPLTAHGQCSITACSHCEQIPLSEEGHLAPFVLIIWHTTPWGCMF